MSTVQNFIFNYGPCGPDQLERDLPILDGRFIAAGRFVCLGPKLKSPESNSNLGGRSPPIVPPTERTNRGFHQATQGNQDFESDCLGVAVSDALWTAPGDTVRVRRGVLGPYAQPPEGSQSPLIEVEDIGQPAYIGPFINGTTQIISKIQTQISGDGPRCGTIYNVTPDGVYVLL